jgi:hypothetical protein
MLIEIKKIFTYELPVPIIDLTRLYLTNEFALASVEFLLLQSFCALA